MNYRYSVIIPAYNAEATLTRCLDSLLTQKREDVQIILVSDGSTDGTDAIAQSYGDRICFLRVSHGGVSAARNRGLELARGQYVTFLDSDDWVRDDYFEKLDREPDCDILIFGLNRRLNRALRREDPVAALLRARKMTPVYHRRFRGDFLRESGVKFVEGLQVGEDFLFCFTLSLQAKSIRGSEMCIYNMDTTDQTSLSRRFRPHLAEDLERVYTLAAQFGRYLEHLDFLWARSVLTCLAELWKAGNPNRKEISDIVRRFQRRIGPCRGILHRALRFALTRRWDALLAGIAWLGKGRKFRP